MTGISRRGLLRSILGISAAGLPFGSRIGHRDALAISKDTSTFLSCFGTDTGSFGTGSFGVAAFDRHLLFRAKTPGRGHGVVVHHERPDFVVVARRPDTWLAVFDRKTAAPLKTVQCPDNRHLLGHGVYDRTGSLLFVTENDFEAGLGIVGIYNARDGYRREGEFASHGVGPHELVLEPRGRYLLVANGGIRTHPDTGRLKLNLDTMQSSVVALDVRTGDVLRSWSLPPSLHQLSLRHLRCLPNGGFPNGGFPNGGFIVAAQFEGPRNEIVPLVFQGSQESAELRPMDFGEELYRAMSHYCGSVAVSADGRFASVSAPRGNRVVIFSVDGEINPHVLSLEDGSGIGFDGQSLFATSGSGAVVKAPLDAPQTESPMMHLQETNGLRWDNHLTAI